jgi:Fanconi anemia group M protein
MSFLFLSTISDNELCSRDAMGRNVDSVNCLELDSGDMEHQEETCDVNETIPETPDAKRTLSNEGANATETENPIEQTSSLAIDACDNDMRDEELSPRLTNLIISGVVPESPIDERGGCHVINVKLWLCTIHETNCKCDEIIFSETN